MLNYKDLQDEVKRRATLDQGGTQFDTAIKNALNSSLFRLGRETFWRVLRRTTSFNTVTSYTTGSGGGTFTKDSKAVTMVGATLLTDDVKVGRRVTLQGDSTAFTIKTITGETTFTVDQDYGGTTISGTGTYAILPQEEYNLPVQSSHRVFLSHEEWGYPVQLNYIKDSDFVNSSAYRTTTSIPIVYRMWNSDMIKEQLLEASVIRVTSSSASDTSVNVTVFGIVSGLPDFEVIAVNGTTAASGSKSFSSVERVVKDASTTGRITVDANTANTEVVVLPVGDTTGGITYSKVKLYPLPNNVFPITVQYYKDPYRLVEDTDVHDFGQEFDEAIILLATSKIKFQSNQDEGAIFDKLYKEELRSLKTRNSDKPDYINKMRRRYGRTTSMGPHAYVSYQQMGPWFGPRV